MFSGTRAPSVKIYIGYVYNMMTLGHLRQPRLYDINNVNGLARQYSINVQCVSTDLTSKYNYLMQITQQISNITVNMPLCWPDAQCILHLCRGHLLDVLFKIILMIVMS